MLGVFLYLRLASTHVLTTLGSMLAQDIDRGAVPTTPGVYLFLSKGGKPLYIGKAKNLHKRLQHYFSPKSLRKQDMVAKAHRIQWLQTRTDEEAIILETNLIREHRPMYNNLIKGEHAYVYLKIAPEPFPNITLTRYKKDDKAIYIGPKVRRRQLKKTLHIIRSIMQRRACSKKQFNAGVVCSDYFFGLCAGRCAYAKGEEKQENNKNIGFKPLRTTAEAQERYKDSINRLVAYFNGNHTLLEERIRQDIDIAVEKKHFERAAKLRDALYALRDLQQPDSILERPHTGIWVHITTMGTRYIYCVIKLYEGKTIDIILGKEACEESSHATIIHMVEQEYNCTLHIYHEDAELHAGSTIKKFLKKEQKHLALQANNYMTSYIQSTDEHNHLIHNELLTALQQRYYFRTFPYLIECVDISHLGGDHTVGAVTRMMAGKLDKNAYRRYRITSTDTGDDYRALEEVISRRFTKEPRPDIFILDGGVGQLGIINTLDKKNNIPRRNEIRQHTTFVALGKGKARSRKGKQAGKQEYISYFTSQGDIDVRPLWYDAADRLLILLRDEAHRFANAYRKKRMQQDFQKT